MCVIHFGTVVFADTTPMVHFSFVIIKIYDDHIVTVVEDFFRVFPINAWSHLGYLRVLPHPLIALIIRPFCLDILLFFLSHSVGT